MRRDEVFAILSTHEAELRELGVEHLAIFGSVARDEAGPESDVDILVEFRRPVGLFEFVGLKYRLEELLGRRVDLATSQSLKERMRRRVLSEAVDVR